MTSKYPKQLQVKIDKKTRKQLNDIAKLHRRTMSDVVRLLIEREACRPSDPASLLATCGGIVLADDAATGHSTTKG
jgi:hypothetical protein